jgi:hypothetical protein
MTAPSAYRIEQAMAVAQSLRQRLLQDDPDLAADEAALRDTLDGETDVYDLMRRLARFTLDAEAMAAAAKARAENLAARKQRYERRAQAARGALFGMLDAMGERRLDDAEFTATISAGRKQVVITDEAAIPDRFWETSRTLKKADVNAAVKAGEDVPGAMQTNGLPTLTIKAS